jgi:hypothetical protein
MAHEPAAVGLIKMYIEDVRDVLHDVPAAALNWKGGDKDGWSLAHVLTHLYRSDELMWLRFERLLNEDLPAVIPFGGDETLRDGLINDPQKAWEKERLDLVNWLEGLPVEAWDRAGMHPLRGRITIRSEVAEMVGHDVEHLGQMRVIRDAWDRQVTSAGRA